MEDKPKPGLSPQDASEIIADITTSDRERARLAIGAGVQAAQAQWIEAPLIAEALALELIAVAEHSHPRSGIATYLRQLAEAMETQPSCH